MNFESFVGRRHLMASRRGLRAGALLKAIVIRLLITTVVAAVLIGIIDRIAAVNDNPLFTDLLAGTFALNEFLMTLGIVVLVVMLFLFSPRILGVSVSAHIAALVVIAGVASVIVVMALLEGMDQNFHRKHMDLLSHFEVLPAEREGNAVLASPEVIAQLLSETPDVEAFAPLIRREVPVMPERELSGRRTAMQVFGVDPAQTRSVASFVDRVIAGSGEPRGGEVVLSNLLAHGLDVRLGDSIWALSRIVIDAHAVVHPRWQELRVVGVFTTGVPELDMASAFVSLETARAMFLLPDDAIGGYQVRVKNPAHAERVAHAFANAHPGVPMTTRAWSEANPEFFAALELEKRGTIIMLIMIVLVSAFSIVGTLVMIVSERTREIGMLRAMGADDSQIRGIFLRGGLMIGLVGTVIGLGLGLGICLVLSRMPVPIPLYDLTTVPILVHVPTVVGVVAITVIATVIASIVPARAASRLDPIEALRHD